MTQKEFQGLPWLLKEQQVEALGYDRRTLRKMVDCQVLKKVSLPGCGQGRYQKRQLALLLRWDHLLQEDMERFKSEPPLMMLKAVQGWTGFAEETLSKIMQAQGLTAIRPPGVNQGKFLKAEVAGLLGVGELV